MSALRVAIDATPLVVPIGGTARYVVELVAALGAQFPNDEFHLISDQTSWTLPDRLSRLANVVREPPRWRGLWGSWWTTGLPWELRRRGVDVFHGTDFSVPYLPLAPSVMMIHDLSPWKRAPIRPLGSDRVRHRTPCLLKIATHILTPTEAVRAELAATFAVSLNRITAVPLAAFDPGIQAARDQPKVTAPYILYIGALDARKNVQTLIAAWRRARANVNDLSLVLAVPPRGEAPPNEPGLHRFAGLSDAEVTQLLSGAVAFVYPSLYEGFGLPVIEAMRAGIPVITSPDPAITEVASGAAVQVDVTSAETIAQAILSVVTSSETQGRLGNAGKRRAAEFSWRRTARRTRDVYAETIERF